MDKCLEIIPDCTGVGLDRFHCILVLSQRPLRDLCLFVFGAARLKGTFGNKSLGSFLIWTNLFTLL